MTRTTSSLGTAIFLLLAPGTVAGLVPWWMTRWQRAPGALAAGEVVAVFGIALILLGLIGLLESFARFAHVGRGTPAPGLPTQRLVVGGFYGFVRNPMYLAVVALIIGQGLYFGRIGVLVYGLGVWLVFHAFVVSYEEPTLRRSFPADYATFFANVPRWLPRLTPWTMMRSPI